MLLLVLDLRRQHQEKRDTKIGRARVLVSSVQAASGTVDRIHELDVAVHNYGSTPVFGVKVDGHLQGRPFSTIPLGHMGPGAICTRQWLLEESIFNAKPEILDIWVTVVVTFTDSDGLQWERRGDDEPTRLINGMRPVRLRIRARWRINRARGSAAGFARRGWTWVTSR